MPANCLYVDGYALDQFLGGYVAFRRKRYGSNHVLVLCNKPAPIETINAVNAARATIGLDAQIVELETPLVMRGWVEDGGKAQGMTTGVPELLAQIEMYDLDALAISTRIDVDEAEARAYLSRGSGVNPWGRVEAQTCREISEALGVPVAHAPTEGVITEWNEIAPPCVAAEVVSVAYLHCVLKGLHRAPELINYGDHVPSDLTAMDIDFMVSPYACWGPPHEACERAGIEMIFVRNNPPAHGCLNPEHSYKISCANYAEAAGHIMARRAGVSLESLQRPLLVALKS